MTIPPPLPAASPSHARRSGPRSRSSWVGAGARRVGGICLSLIAGMAGAASVTPLHVSSAYAASTEDGAVPANPSRAAEVPWEWPSPEPRIVARAFDPPSHEYGAGHRGIDIAAPAGSPVSSPADGVVLFAGPVAGRSVLTIDHGGGVVTSFDPVIPAVSAGVTVARGSVIGSLEPGTAMHCAEGCLHLGVRLDGRYVDPLPFFGRPVRAVLLPLDE